MLFTQIHCPVSDSGSKYEFWIFLETILNNTQNVTSQNKHFPNVNCCCQLYCTCVYEIVCPYTAPVWSAYFAHKMNFPRSLLFSYSKCYKYVGNNQLPYYSHVLKPLIQQVNVSTRTVPGGKHLAPLMLVAKLPVTPMDGRHHPRPTSS